MSNYHSHPSSSTQPPSSLFKGCYQLEAQVGMGGMATVYRAIHTGLGLPVAVKFLSPYYAQNQQLRGRFLQEARIQFQLKHPNIVQVTDTIDEYGQLGYVLEWIDGTDLQKWFQHRQMPLKPTEMWSLMEPILSGVQYAHSKGVIHRDLKPSNILLHVEQGKLVPKVADFGIAKLLGHEGQPMTLSQETLGTLQYMAPEQIDNSRGADHRADIYSLGVILFELLTGQPPFSGSASHLTYAHLWEPPPPPRSLRPDLHPKLEDILLKCLAKQPEERYVDISALTAELQESLTSPSPSSLSTQSVHAKPSKMARTLSILLLLGVLAGVGWNWKLLSSYLPHQKKLSGKGPSTERKTTKPKPTRTSPRTQKTAISQLDSEVDGKQQESKGKDSIVPPEQPEPVTRRRLPKKRAKKKIRARTTRRRRRRKRRSPRIHHRAPIKHETTSTPPKRQERRKVPSPVRKSKKLDAKIQQVLKASCQSLPKTQALRKVYQELSGTFPHSVPQLLQHLKNRNPCVRDLVAGTVLYLDKKYASVRGHIQAATQHKHPWVRRRANSMLRYLNKRSRRHSRTPQRNARIDSILRALQETSSVSRKMRYMRILRRDGKRDPRVTQAFIRLLDDPKVSIRSYAALSFRYLGKYGVKGAPKLVGMIAKSIENQGLLRNIAAGLGGMSRHSGPAFVGLHMFINLPYWRVRADAIRLIGNTGTWGETSIPQLEYATKDKHPLVRKYARQSIQKIKQALKEEAERGRR